MYELIACYLCEKNAMRISSFALPALLLTGSLLLTGACTDRKAANESSGKLVVAAAANVQFAMKELERTFEAESGIDLDIVLSSSGKLTAQIKQGAPYDLLLSANMKYPQALYREGFATTEPAVYALGALVLWTLKASVSLQADPTFLIEPGIEKVAIANPRNAPYGEQAVRLFNHYGIYERIEAKLVYGESIAQTNQYIISKACDAGVTAKSVVLSPEIQGRGSWVALDPAAYAPIKQGVIITRYGGRQHPEACRRFYDFLFSDTARAVFRKYGYEVPEG